MLPSHPLIELRRLHRFFGSTRAVDDVSFEVRAGQVFGFIGPNGAGKTTSMRILATLDLPSAGDAMVDGFSVVNDPDRVRRRLGFMPDYFGTYYNVDCREYLDFFARAYGLTGRLRQQAVSRVMSFTRLDELASKPISGLSKGMKQRLCLGRAMIHDPPVLVLDEPAAGLDPRARIELREMIGQLAADGKALLVSSHILTELAEMCDTVGIIEQGQLLAEGSVDEIQRESANGDFSGEVGVELEGVITIRLVGPTDELAAWLAGRFGDADIRSDGQLLRLPFPSDQEAAADLLSDMIQSGFRVSAFGSNQRSLEDVFLHVTRGKVQ